MYWQIGVLSVVCLIGIGYMIRYYRLLDNLKKAQIQMQEIEQSPEDNRILLLAHSHRKLEELMAHMNAYIMQNQQMRIAFGNREKKLRRQIEAVSHDLRTPLTAILGYLELLDREALSEENKEALLVVQRKADRLQSLITNFYDLSRLELDDYHLHMESVDIGRFVKECLLDAYGDLEQRDLEIIVEDKEGLKIFADRGAMERICGNMLQNAIRYAESYLKVEIGEGKDGEVRIAFENDTAALTQEDIPHLFEKFYMTDAARSGQGTGLGLTISKLLAEAMGGEVTASYDGRSLQISYIFPLFKEL